MGCSSSNPNINVNTSMVSITKEKIQSLLFKKLNFEDIKLNELEFISQNQMILHNKNEGFKELIKETFRKLNKSMRGIFMNEEIKEKCVIKLIYYFFNTGLSNKIDYQKGIFISEYFNFNINNLINFHYSIISIPKIISYLFCQSIITFLLPNGENDLKYFFGGQMKGENFNNYSGTNSYYFVQKKLLEINQYWNILHIEYTLKKDLLNQSEEIYIKDLINKEACLETKNQLAFDKDKINEEIRIETNFLQKLINIMKIYLSPYYLFDLLSNNKEIYKEEKIHVKNESFDFISNYKIYLTKKKLDKNK